MKLLKNLLIPAIAAVVIIVVVLIVSSGSGDITIDIETSLKEMITTSQLRTAEYTYNSIAKVKDGDTVKYYVAYKGKVVAGFNFDQVKIERQENNICILVPDVKIVEVTVDPQMDYIFTKKKYDTEKTYAEASEACKQDLFSKATSNTTLLETARESAEETITALIKPFEANLNDGESFEIVFVTEEGGTTQ